MEYEVRYYFSKEKLNDITSKLKSIKDLKMNERSYERYRTTFSNDEIEISLDEYPFGIALEIENKSNSEKPEEVVKKWVELLVLNIEDAYRLSWDDKYSELCKKQGIERFNHVSFDKPMPKVLD